MNETSVKYVNYNKAKVGISGGHHPQTMPHVRFLNLEEP
jgi:hypothetical protein